MARTITHLDVEILLPVANVTRMANLVVEVQNAPPERARKATASH
jgi:hypothetical protein